MSKDYAKITHIFHSGFLVETENHTLIFDYIEPKNYDKRISDDFFINKENSFIFVTHSHKDHFYSKIYDWSKYNSELIYILSNDIIPNHSEPNIYLMEKYNNLKIKEAEITTYGTTDKGVSFLVKVDGINIYHAGDLNWWHWKSDSSTTQKKEEIEFKQEVDNLKNVNIDIAFIPVDPRLEEFYYLAAEYFAKTIKPQVIVPMHFEDNFEITHNLKGKLKDIKCHIVSLDENNYKFNFKKK